MSQIVTCKRYIGTSTGNGSMRRNASATLSTRYYIHVQIQYHQANVPWKSSLIILIVNTAVSAITMRQTFLHRTYFMYYSIIHALVTQVINFYLSPNKYLPASCSPCYCWMPIPSLPSYFNIIRNKTHNVATYTIRRIAFRNRITFG
jgi:hypothetical protein